MMKDSKVFVSIAYVCSLLVHQTDQCILTNNSQSLPSFTNYGRDVDRITRYHQAIIPSYKFTCCGGITAWRVDVEPGGGRDDEEYTLNFQVWRPSPTVGQIGGGDYSLVGNNRFTSISLTDGVAESLLPSPSDYILFQPGDVLGFYVEDVKEDMNTNRGVAVLTTDSYTNELVWYASTSQTVTGCPISVGDLSMTLQGAPVISISTEISDCPQILPTPPPCPITPPPTTTITSEPVASFTTNMAPDFSTPNENTLPTDSTPGEVVSIDDRGSGGGGPPVSVIAAVVLAILVAIILTVLILVLIAVVVSKKWSKKTFNVTHTNLRVGITNKLYGQNPSVNDPTYDYVDEKFPVVGYETANENVIFSGSLENTYHEAVLYHSTGPRASKSHGTPGVSERAGAHIYDDASMQLLPAGSTTSSGHPVYEDPTLSQVYYSRSGTESTHDDVAIVPVFVKGKGCFDQFRSFQ